MNDITTFNTNNSKNLNVDCTSGVVERLHNLEHRITKLEEIVSEYEKKKCHSHSAKLSSSHWDSHSSLEFKLALLQVMNAELTLLERKLANIAAPVSFVT
ncbi:hypothetical protein EG68_10912 [Paragonimus skrjabini miyazakii]|uniref:Uncharacterized protein n=1 Tax=Paragonimus skrjabini miyazakii TaxID=59628 RepID=A0A8S9YKR7_9TREM|nr:hypothetical protein EG68_10912 [Paragonimus skrjabini miyazakii]